MSVRVPAEAAGDGAGSTGHRFQAIGIMLLALANRRAAPT